MIPTTSSVPLRPRPSPLPWLAVVGGCVGCGYELGLAGVLGLDEELDEELERGELEEGAPPPQLPAPKLPPVSCADAGATSAKAIATMTSATRMQNSMPVGCDLFRIANGRRNSLGVGRGLDELSPDEAIDRFEVADPIAAGECVEARRADDQLVIAG